MLDINLLDEDILEFITYVNVELLQGREMKDIEKNDFFVNERVIVKRLARRNYKRLPNTANIVDTNGNLIKIFREEENIDIMDIQNKEIISEEKDNNELITCNENIKSNELLELVNRKKEIFKVLDYFNNTPNKVGNIEKRLRIHLPPSNNKEFKVTTRINDIVWQDFKKFSRKYPCITLKDLTSQALIEFMKKYD